MTLQEEFVGLSWELLKAKIIYYLYTEHFEVIPDWKYDEMEARYLELCKLLNCENTVQSMVGIDTARPSVRIVMDKLWKR